MLCAGQFIVRRCVALFFWAEIHFFLCFLCLKFLVLGKAVLQCCSLQWAEHFKVFISLKFIASC